MEIALILGVIALVAAAAIFSAIQARKRREALQALASSLGLHFDPAKDYSMDGQYAFLGKLCQGSNRYAFNRIYGPYQGQQIMAFDYHYETHSHDSKGRRQTHHHYLSFFLLHLPGQFPELTITKEGWGSKLAQWAGYDDIDFESAEFSGKFCVRSSDKKFAYDICNAQMITYLIEHPDLTIEIECHCLSLVFQGALSSEQIAYNLNRLLQIRQRIPDYLFQH